MAKPGCVRILASRGRILRGKAPASRPIQLFSSLLGHVVRNGWRLLAHPLFLDQLERLVAAVERARRADPAGWAGRADAKLLAALRELVLERVPRDPLGPEFRQGNTLGAAHRRWFRAKFGGNRFRLFFRADSRAKVIVYAWVNDRDTLRKAGAATDPYVVFATMLAGGNPPDDWPALMAAAEREAGRLSGLG